MQTQNPFFDDIARMMSGAMGVAAGMREEMEQRFRQMFESTAQRMDLVSREEFEAVKAMAAKAREENEALARRVAELEKAAKPKGASGAAAKAGAKGGARRAAPKTGTAKASGAQARAPRKTGTAKTSGPRSAPEPAASDAGPGRSGTPEGDAQG